MQTYIALLRGINVSGQKSIKMAELRKHLTELDFTDVQTYIQSGNIVFKCNDTDPKTPEKKLAGLIQNKYGFDVAVIVRSVDELIQIRENSPYLKDSSKDRDRQYFTILAEEPAPENLKRLDGISYEPEEYILNSRTIYFYSPNGYGNAKMNNNFFENKLKVKATTRNLKTLDKLIEMGGA